MILPEWTACRKAGVPPLRQDLFLCPLEERDDCICLQTAFEVTCSDSIYKDTRNRFHWKRSEGVCDTPLQAYRQKR